MKRHAVVIPPPIYKKLETIGARYDLLPKELLQRFLTLGLVAAECEMTGDGQVIIRDKKGDRILNLLGPGDEFQDPGFDFPEIDLPA